MIRILLLIPEGLTFDVLTKEQQEAIQSVFGQYVMPMPSTLPFEGRVICDALADDKFNPQNMVDLGLPFEIIGIFHSDGSVLVSLNETEFLARLPQPETGNKVLEEVHRWSGWAKCFGE